MAAGKTDPGMRRPNNEDAFLVADDLGLYLVADGLGGHPSGEVASALAVRTAAAVVREAGHTGAGAAVTDVLTGAVREANRAILAQDIRDDSGQGMATTLSVLLLEPGMAHVAHVGDCRIYRWRPGAPLRRLTRDHSQVQTLVDQGLLTEEQAVRHPWSHRLERVLGLEHDLAVDVTSEPREPADRFLLCSDGLVRVMGDEEIGSMLGLARDPAVLVERLVHLARERGAPDNVTVVVVFGDGGQPPCAG